MFAFLLPLVSIHLLCSGCAECVLSREIGAEQARVRYCCTHYPLVSHSAGSFSCVLPQSPILPSLSISFFSLFFHLSLPLSWAGARIGDISPRSSSPAARKWEPVQTEARSISVEELERQQELAGGEADSQGESKRSSEATRELVSKHSSLSLCVRACVYMCVHFTVCLQKRRLHRSPLRPHSGCESCTQSLSVSEKTSHVRAATETRCKCACSSSHRRTTHSSSSCSRQREEPRQRPRSRTGACQNVSTRVNESQCAVCYFSDLCTGWRVLRESCRPPSAQTSKCSSASER